MKITWIISFIPCEKIIDTIIIFILYMRTVQPLRWAK